MENNRFWIFLGLFVAVALSLKWWATPESFTASKRWSISANMDDEIQFKRSGRREKIAGLVGSRRSTEMVDVKSGATTAAPAPALNKPATKLENKAKKKDDKKKKKKKKTAKVLAVPGAAEQVAGNTKDKNPDLNSPNNGVAFQGAAAAAGFNPNQGPQTLSDWERILLATPNHFETTRFISLFQTKQITSEIFYGIVSEMLNDGRTQMRELGVIALGATPSLKSYEMLVATSEIEHGTIKTQVSSYLDESYNHAQSINVIYAALTETDVPVATQLQALKNLDAIVMNSRTPSSQPTLADDGGVQPQPTRNEVVTQQRVMDYFRLLGPVLNKMSKTATDEKIQTLAQAVFVHINSAIATAANTVHSLAGN